MSRSGYSDDLDGDALNLYRGNVDRAIKGKRGQAFLREMATVLDAMPEKVLIRNDLFNNSGQVCALGAVFKARGLDPEGVDQDNPQEVGTLVGIAIPLAAEIAYLNDEGYDDYHDYHETPEERWVRMRRWIKENTL